ncbi:hypothetical protein JZ751_011458 [Albula glossodonta]|uniref:Thrombospondin type-1 domain-containing protein n=1 Tax=Albula glossodonta TaxID=121402 RepID=A0A8T2N258_9TELE|nr:hypothetical protein JZ751_011458 [Albula glossodonta]
MWRRRAVLQASQGDGRPCPSQMEQWKPCLVKPCYRWQYSPWSECRVEVSVLPTLLLTPPSPPDPSPPTPIYGVERLTHFLSRALRSRPVRVTARVMRHAQAFEGCAALGRFERQGSEQLKAERDAECGEGLKDRNVSCVVWDGLGAEGGSMVEEELCATLDPLQDGDKRIALEESCSVPCPGNLTCTGNHTCDASAPDLTCTGDCYLTEWSSWSRCELTCVNGVDLGLGSVQVRSRAAIAQEPDSLPLCPQQEWESRPCPDGQCYEYTWITSEWKGHSRQVWCQRSDGLNVTGGCPLAIQPLSDRSCDPACDKPRSFCTEAGVCGCEEGYTEVMSSEGVLEQCTLIPVLEIPTAGVNEADVKTIRAASPTQPTASQAGRAGRTWFLQPFGPDGKLKTWVYGVAAGVLVLLVFIVSMTYLACYCVTQRYYGTEFCVPSGPPAGTVVWMKRNANVLTFMCPE